MSVEINCGEEMNTLCNPIIVPAEVISSFFSGPFVGAASSGVRNVLCRGANGVGARRGVDCDGRLSSGFDTEIPCVGKGGTCSPIPPYGLPVSTGLKTGVPVLELAILSRLETSFICDTH